MEKFENFQKKLICRLREEPQQIVPCFFILSAHIEFAVCLYEVGEWCHKTFKRWFEHEKFGGIPIIPARYKLDEVIYRLEGL